MTTEPRKRQTATAMMKSHGSRFVKFGIVGGLGILVNMLAYALLHEKVGIADFIGRALAIEIAVLHNFSWNFFWTWRDRGRSFNTFFNRLLRYHGSTFIASFVIPLVIGWIVDRTLDDFPFANYISHLTGIAAGMLVNYLISDLWVFRAKKKRPDDKADPSE